MTAATILLLPGDGIGPEVVHWAEAVLAEVSLRHQLGLRFETAAIGGVAIDATGEPLPAATLQQARSCQAILLGATGGPRWDELPPEKRPERGLLQLRAEMELFANLRPARLHPQLGDASSLKIERVKDLDLLVVRELIGGIYFGEPRGVRRLPDGQRQAYNTAVYAEGEIRRIAEVAFAAARGRRGRLCSVDKANVLEVSRLWRELVTELAAEYQDVELSHMYIDNAAMQLVAAPSQFDVILTSNLFGDILSDIAANLTGSIGLLPSASMNAGGVGLYEPCHGSAPDIAGRDLANPLAAILSAAMLLRHSLQAEPAAQAVEQAVTAVLDRGLRTADIAAAGQAAVGTAEMGEAVLQALA